MSEKEAAENAQEQQKQKKSIIPLITLVLLIVTMAGTGANIHFTLARCGKSMATTPATAEESEPAVKQAYYFSLDPAFVVNFSGKGQGGFLQVSINGLTRDSTIKQDITKHLPQIRNSIVLLLSRQKYSDLNSLEGKEALRKNILTSIQTILKNEIGNEGVEDVYFSDFIMQ